MHIIYEYQFLLLTTFSVHIAPVWFWHSRVPLSLTSLGALSSGADAPHPVLPSPCAKPRFYRSSGWIFIDLWFSTYIAKKLRRAHTTHPIRSVTLRPFIYLSTEEGGNYRLLTTDPENERRGRAKLQQPSLINSTTAGRQYDSAP